MRICLTALALGCYGFCVVALAQNASPPDQTQLDQSATSPNTRSDSSSADLATVRRAIEDLDATAQDKHWRYTILLVEDGEKRTISHDPHGALYQQRELLLIDGEPPSDKALRKFRDAEKERIDGQDPDASYFDLVDMGTVNLIEHSATSEVYAFTPRLEEFKEVEGRLAGKLIIDSANGKVAGMEIYSTEGFSPAFSVSLESYTLHFRFREEQGHTLMVQMSSHAVGKIGFLKTFDTRTEVEITNFQRVISASTKE